MPTRSKADEEADDGKRKQSTLDVGSRRWSPVEMGMRVRNCAATSSPVT